MIAQQRGVARGRRWLRRLGKIVVAMLLVVGIAFMLLTDRQAMVAAMPPPDALTVGHGMEALRRVKNATAVSGGAPVSLETPQLAGLMRLASDALAPLRADAAVTGTVATVRVSRPTIFGRWINATATVSGNSKGFPPIAVRIGSVPIPQWLVRFGLSVGWRVAAWRGIVLPPRDDLVRSVSVQQNRFSATVRMPPADALAAALARLRSTQIDQVAVRAHYCRVLNERRLHPTNDFAVIVRTLFSGPGVGTVEGNRAAMVALALVAVPEHTRNIGGLDFQAGCVGPVADLLLHNRFDLPKHWALSAALAASVGGRAAESVGTWKELADSDPDGSGFSFIDLAADRAGFRYALASADGDARAAQIARQLSSATAEQLVPPQVLDGPEGLARIEFERRYQRTDSARYKHALAIIDRELNPLVAP